MKRTAHFLRRVRAWISQPRMIIQERIIAVDDLNRCTDPIFLIGLHRSGTSLMRRIFNSHPEIACPPETYFLEHYATMLRDPMVEAGYKGFGHNKDSMRTHIANTASVLHEGYRRSQNKRRWADKTPQYLTILPELKELFGPGARFVMIYRHPFDVAYSVWYRGWNLSGEEGDRFDNLLKHMKKMYEKQISFELDNPDICTRIHYEDVVAEPEDVLMRVTQALGEQFSPSMLEHHKGSHNFGTEDPIARGLKGFQASHGNWLSLDNHYIEKMHKVLGPVCSNLGYSTSPEYAKSGGRS